MRPPSTWQPLAPRLQHCPNQAPKRTEGAWDATSLRCLAACACFDPGRHDMWQAGTITSSHSQATCLACRVGHPLHGGSGRKALPELQVTRPHSLQRLRIQGMCTSGLAGAGYEMSAMCDVHKAQRQADRGGGQHGGTAMGGHVLCGLVPPLPPLCAYLREVARLAGL